MTQETTLLDSLINAAKNNRILASLIFICIVIIGLGSLTDALSKLEAYIFPQHEIGDGVKNAIGKQVSIDPPFYGNSMDGNVRKVMEEYIDGYKFPKNSPGDSAKKELISMIEVRKNPDKPEEFFKADDTFRAAMEKFRSNARFFAHTGKWQSD